MSKALQLCALLLIVTVVYGLKRSSHSEAPGTAQIPSADITDYYVFRSYETGRSNYVDFLLNVWGLQSSFAGPNYFSLSTSHFYEMYIDTSFDGVEDYTFQFIFGNGLPIGSTPGRPYIYYDDFLCNQLYANASAAIQPATNIPTGIALNVSGQSVKIALKVAGSNLAQDQSGLNWREYYSLNLIRGNLSNPTSTVAVADTNGNTVFSKPFDYAGENSFGTASQYETYAMNNIHSIDLSNLGLTGCTTGSGKVWVGQRSDPFWISLGRIFDYLNLIPVSHPLFVSVAINNNCSTNNDLREKNVITIALEIPIACFSLAGSNIMYTWAGVRNLIHADGDITVPQTSHIAGTQVSRLGNPLVNELVIGLIEKDRFSRQRPTLDADGNLGFATYVLYPTLPEIVTGKYLGAVSAILGQNFTSLSPPTPRFDLAAAFLTGIPGVTQGATSGFIGEVMRINLGIAPTPWGQQNNLGLGGTIAGAGPPGYSTSDQAGFPNGRRPGDDVVDIALMAMMGLLCTSPFGFINVSASALNTAFTSGVVCQSTNSPIAGVRLTDGANVQDINYYAYFPYFTTPTPGSYVSGPTADQTVCYPPSFLGRCPLPPSSSSTAPSMVPPTQCPNTGSSSTLKSWMDIFNL